MTWSHSYCGMWIGKCTQAFDKYHFQWRWVISSDLAKYSMSQSIVRGLSASAELLVVCCSGVRRRRSGRASCQPTWRRQRHDDGARTCERRVPLLRRCTAAPVVDVTVWWCARTALCHCSPDCCSPTRLSYSYRSLAFWTTSPRRWTTYIPTKHPRDKLPWVINPPRL